VDPGRDARGHFGEDVLLGWAARRGGARAAFAEDALVRHAVFPRGAAEFVAERLRLGYFPELVRRVPELRRTMLFARVFLSSRTAAVDLAVLALLAALIRRSPPLALAALPYANRLVSDARRRARGRGEAIETLAADLVADLVGLGALLRGSAASRSLLL
jgi:hypothetical protein